MWKALLALVFVFLLAAPPLIWWFAQRPVPELEGAGQIPGLSKTVIVGFDSRNVPYIQADTEEDMYAAQGYVVARERMFQMDILRRSAEGLISEVFGIEFLPSDRLVRTLGFGRLAQEEVDKLSPGARAALEAYCRGINAYLNQYSDRLPVEFILLGVTPKAWTPADSLAISKYLSYELDESWKLDELRSRVTTKVGDLKAAELFKDDYTVAQWVPDQLRASSGSPQLRVSQSHANDGMSGRARHAWTPEPAAQEPGGLCQNRLQTAGGIVNDRKGLARRADDFASAARISSAAASGLAKIAGAKTAGPAPSPLWGSTAWVMPGRNSKSNLPLLAADKHGPLSAPNEWFLCSMASPAVHVAGVCLPGVPGILSGRNDYIAWSGSSLRADVQDLFVEHFDSELGSKYKTAAGEESATDLREVIPVRFGKSVEHRITRTKHGPVLFRDKETAVALSWSGLDTSRPLLNSLYAMNKARTYDDFVAAIANWGGSPQLFVCGDTNGTVGCHGAGLIPVRAGGGTGTTMSEGWLGRGEWTSWLTFNDLPQVRFTADSSERKTGNFAIAAGQRIAQGKLIGHQWAPPYRANRLALGLPRAPAAKLGLAELNNFQSDHYAMLSRVVVDELKRAANVTRSIDAVQTFALDQLNSWDGMVTGTSAAASVYESFVTTLARRLIEPKLGPDLTRQYFERWPLWITFVERYLREKPADWMPPEERMPEAFLITTFAKANTRLKLFFKDDDVASWQWQQIHQGSFKHVITNGLPWLAQFFNSAKVGMPGDSETLDCFDYPAGSKSGPFEARNGPIARLLIDLGDNDKFYAGIAMGQSGHLFSPYKDDQLSAWLHSDALPVAFSRTQVEKQNKTKLYLSAQ